MIENEEKNKMSMVKILFAIYCILLVWIILFKLSFSINDLSRFRSMNLIPFYYNSINAKFHFREIIENVLIFIPFGIYLKVIGINTNKAIVYGFSISLLLEVCQYIFYIGASDITDIITNTLGTVIGVLFYKVLEEIFKDTNRINKVLQILAFIVTTLFILLIILIFLANV